MVLNRLEKEIQEIREHEKADELPDAFWEEVNAVEDWEVYSSEEGLPVLSNFETDDPDLNQLVDEVYEGGIEIAEIYEFSEAVAENPYITAQAGPTIEVETSEGFLRVYPVWKRWDNSYALDVESDDEYVSAELLILTKDDIEDIDLQEAVFEAIRDWVRGE